MMPAMFFKMVKPAKQLLPNQVVFRVPIDVNKIQIKRYLETIYGVRRRADRLRVAARCSACFSAALILFSGSRACGLQVKILRVNTVILPGKTKRFPLGKTRFSTFVTKDRKKAIVTLSENFTMPTLTQVKTGKKGERTISAAATSRPAPA